MSDWNKIKKSLNTAYDVQIIERLYEAGFVICDRQNILDSIIIISGKSGTTQLREDLKNSLTQPM